MSKYGLLAVSIVALCMFWSTTYKVKCEMFDALEFWQSKMQLQTLKVETSKNKTEMSTPATTNSTKKLKKTKSEINFRRKNSVMREIENAFRIDPVEENTNEMSWLIERRDNRQGIRREDLNIDRQREFPPLSFNKLSPYTIAKQLGELNQYFPNENITQEIIGRTVEYNDIVLLKIKHKFTYKPNRTQTKHDHKYEDETPENKIIFIVHGLSVMGITELPCLIKIRSFLQLLDIYLQFSHAFDIYLIPMANPDGVASAKQFWNKNMSPQKNCLGVALDRNFDVAWNQSKKINTCSQQFPGSHAFSELETQAIRDVFERYGAKIAAYFHVHAGMFYDGIFKGEAVLYPKGYTNASEDDKYSELKGEIDDAMKNANFRFLKVAVETLHNWYGPVSGTSVDYASTVYGIPYAMELSMQLYENTMDGESAEQETNVALQHVWRPVIEAIFEKIYDAIESKAVSF